MILPCASYSRTVSSVNISHQPKESFTFKSVPEGWRWGRCCPASCVSECQLTYGPQCGNGLTVTLKMWHDAVTRAVLASCSQQCSSVMHSEHQCALWIQHVEAAPSAIYWEKSESLKMKSSSLEQNVVASYEQTSLVFSFLTFQLKIKSFQGLFFFSHSSPELQHLLKGFALAPHSWWELRDVSTSARQRVRVRAASAVCRNTGHSISLLLQMHLLLPKHGFSQMRSLLRQERPAGNIFQGSRSICAAPKHQRSSPSNFQWNSLSKNKTWAWTVSQR